MNSWISWTSKERCQVFDMSVRYFKTTWPPTARSTDVSKHSWKPRRHSVLLTLCKWAWSLFLASVVSRILALKQLFTVLNMFHMSFAHWRRILSISPLRRSEEARSFCERAMFSCVYLAQDSGIVMLKWYKKNHNLLTKAKWVFLKQYNPI